MKPLLIVGLARSRTYWLSKYFNSYNFVVAKHELSMQLESVAEFEDIMLDTGPVQMVNSDCMLAAMMHTLNLDDYHIVYIKRDLKECRESLGELVSNSEISFTEDELDWLINFQYDTYNKMGILTIDYTDLDSRLKEIHDLIGVPYNPETHEAMKRVKVNSQQAEVPVKVTLEKVLKWLYTPTN
jgi:hypothetical protein